MRNLKTRKCPYIAHFGLKWKNKTTLFCQTFKVEEKKVVSFFNFELNQARYGHFLVFNIFALMSPFVKFEPPCGTPKSASIWLKFFLVYILMYWNGINNLLSTFEKLFEIWSTLTWRVIWITGMIHVFQYNTVWEGHEILNKAQSLVRVCLLNI